MQTPVYLAAFTANNSPGDTWGPRRKIHHYGVYAHLSSPTTNNTVPTQEYGSNHSPVPSYQTNIITDVNNPTFNPDSVDHDYDDPNRNTKF